MAVPIIGTGLIYAAPALGEPFGPGILEAARRRCALVLADVPPLSEVWEDAAIFVDPLDPRALDEVLACLLDAPGLRKDLGERAERRAEELTVGHLTPSRLHRHLPRSVPV